MNLKKIESYIALLLLLMLIITVHESGHLLAARSIGLDTNEINIGFGIPYLEILSLNFDVGDITFHIKPIMLGGYVVMPEEFENMEFYKKFFVYVAGCAFNIISGILILTILGVINKKTILDSLRESIHFLLSLITIDDLVEKASANQYVNTLRERNMIQLFLINFSVVSFFIAIINLLPIFPLDGGRIIFDSMINVEEINIVIAISIMNYWVIKDRKKILSKIKNLKNKRF